MTEAAVLWRRLDRAGHEAARLSRSDAGWRLEGTAVFADDGGPCRLDYRVDCDAGWRTRSARVAGWMGSRTVEVGISVGPGGRWEMNGVERPAVQGCVDVDLNFSPSTNLLPIRRLSPEVGAEVAVRAAWLRFPSFELEPLDQRYRRIDASIYRYESTGGFVRELQVSDAGLVTLYPGFFAAEASL
ncbi:MAG TPA: putative glycolipid-binding domain-containing protein [Longimicrobiaceae bacterium]|nr:putative glycolipid-binding domain-containing protein [Longimicrobiaceae bacterium]